MTGTNDHVCAAWVVEVFCDGCWQRSSVCGGTYASKTAAEEAIVARFPSRPQWYRAVLGADSPPTIGNHMKYEIQFHSPTTGWERSAEHPDLFDDTDAALTALLRDTGKLSYRYRVVEADTGNEQLFTAKQRIAAVDASTVADAWVPQDEIAGPDVYVVTEADGKRHVFRTRKPAQFALDALLYKGLGPLTVALVPTYIRIPRTEEP